MDSHGAGDCASRVGCALSKGIAPLGPRKVPLVPPGLTWLVISALALASTVALGRDPGVPRTELPLPTLPTTALTLPTPTLTVVTTTLTLPTLPTTALTLPTTTLTVVTTTLTVP